jgi:intracellular sulfur oxidation DsrE/DsrF family protein
MQDDDKKTVGRRRLISTMGVAAVAGLAASGSARAQSAEPGFQPARHAQDAWMNDIPGNHRVFVDSATMPGGANAMRYANNILFTHGEAYGGSESDYAMIVCFRHTSTPYAYNDAMWAKYGGLFDRSADPAPVGNPMNTANRANGENTIADLASRGVRFAICNKATQSYSRMLAQATGQSFDAVYEELLANAIVNGRFVPAGVLAATRAQEYGYSLLYAE